MNLNCTIRHKASLASRSCFYVSCFEVFFFFDKTCDVASKGLESFNNMEQHLRWSYRFSRLNQIDKKLIREICVGLDSAASHSRNNR